MLVKLSLFAIIVSSVGNSSESCNCMANKRITVIGKAENSKAIAVVITDNGPYFLDGVYMWDEKYEGRTVKVTGKLVIKTYEKQSTPERLVQERVGTIHYLQKAKWSLVE
jgi:hypothetical protein